MLQLLERRGSTSAICIHGLYQLILLHRSVPSPPDLPCSGIILSVTSLPDSIKMLGSIEQLGLPGHLCPPLMLSYPAL